MYEYEDAADDYFDKLYSEENEELKFYNKYLPHYSWMRMGEFHAQGGVVN